MLKNVCAGWFGLTWYRVSKAGFRVLPGEAKERVTTRIRRWFESPGSLTGFSTELGSRFWCAGGGSLVKITGSRAKDGVGIGEELCNKSRGDENN